MLRLLLPLRAWLSFQDSLSHQDDLVEPEVAQHRQQEKQPEGERVVGPKEIHAGVHVVEPVGKISASDNSEGEVQSNKQKCVGDEQW